MAERSCQSKPVQLERDMIAELQTVCGSVGDDLGELRTLVDDAIGRLMGVFTSITESAQDHQNGSEATGGYSHAHRSFAREVERQATRVVAYLQFHDKASQMMDNLERRVRAIERGTGHMLEDELDAAADELRQTARIRERNPRNSQIEIAGEVDLF